MRDTGEIKWQGELVFLSEPLANEVVGIVDTDDGDAEVYFGPMMLGFIDGVIGFGPPSSNSAYLIASALGGEPTPPGMFSGADVRKKS